MHNYDIVIVGGGAAGMLMASSLCDLNAKILLIDSELEAKDVDVNIALVLNEVSLRILTSMGLNIAIKDGFDLKGCIVSARGHFGRVRMTSDSLNYKRLGRVVALKSLYGDLKNKIKTQANLTIEYGASVQDVIQNTDSTSILNYIIDANNASVKTKMVIGCDGINSVCRSKFKINTIKESFDYSCLVLHVNLSGADTHCASQRFLSPGSLAFIPTSGSTACLVWTLPTNVIKARSSMPATQLLNIAKHELGKQGRMLKAIIDNPLVYPVSLQRACSSSKPGLVLIGAAATNLFPITAQNLNLSLRDIAAVRDSLQGSDDFIWGQAESDSYVSKRRDDHLFNYNQVKYLLNTFSKTSLLRNILRSTALTVAGSSSSLTSLITRRGVGENTGLADILF
ncbi:MAG: FAD-dependent monooxygenase [Legionellales bacterium]|jgi:ubiquinone biosynthesis UbiH/UbiF/VisC/COQ6 family hydroxylase|nr:FAD-dependent monooxygenase [Legionellales bacterium]